MCFCQHSNTGLLAADRTGIFALYCRSVVERLSVPGVRRLFVVHAETSKVEGIVSLSDMAAYLFDVI